MNPLVAGYFQVLREDLAAARQLAGTVPRASAFHLQQAAEKLVKAILTAEGVHASAEHNIGQLVAKLPDGHAWRADLIELDHLSQFGTTYRYPGPAGRITPPPDRQRLDHYAALISALADEAEEAYR